MECLIVTSAALCNVKGCKFQSPGAVTLAEGNRDDKQCLFSLKSSGKVISIPVLLSTGVFALAQCADVVL